MPMEFIVHNDLNEIYEIIGLTRFTLFPDRIKLLFLDENDLNPFVVNEKLQEIHVKYLKTFSENFVSSPDHFFFFEDEDLDLAMPFNNLLVTNKDWLHNLEAMNDEDIRRKIYESEQALRLDDNDEKYIHRKFYEPVQVLSLDDLVAVMEIKLGENFDIITAAYHFKYILLYRNVKSYFSRFMKIINNNLPAYKKARQAIEIDLTSFLADFKAPPKEYFETKFPDFAELADNRNDLYPSLVDPLSILGLGLKTPIFCGLCVNEGFERYRRQEKPKDILARMLKMLGDENKLRILTMLKTTTMYNLQIATELGISPSATNHHMQALEYQGFVSSRRHNGKVYYDLVQQQVKEAVADIEALLL